MSSPASIVNIKKGATLSLAGVLPTGALYEEGSWSAKCQAKPRGSETRLNLEATLEAPNSPGEQYVVHLFAAASATAAWPVGQLSCDIDFTDAGASPEPYVISTATFTLNVVDEVTQ